MTNQNNLAVRQQLATSRLCSCCCTQPSAGYAELRRRCQCSCICTGWIACGRVSRHFLCYVIHEILNLSIVLPQYRKIYKIKFIPVYRLKAYKGAKVWLRFALISAVDVSGQLHSTAALPPRKELRYTLKRRVAGPNSRCEHFGL